MGNHIIQYSPVGHIPLDEPCAEVLFMDPKNYQTFKKIEAHKKAHALEQASDKIREAIITNQRFCQ